MKKYTQQTLFWLLICVANISNSATISLNLPNGYAATAEYLSGDKNKAAVFILHGMLQTRNYLTVQSLITTAGDDGYTVLAPNLSLSISNRQQSLPCEAIHNHNMTQDIEEIDYWIQWLEKKGHSRIFLIGHSFGSLQILIYSNKKKPKSVIKLITTSLVDVEKTNDRSLIKNDLKRAMQSVKNNNIQLNEYQLAYCTKYISPAKDYISYAKWTKNKLISELDKLSIPITIILGGEDMRLDKNWISRLKQTKLNLIIIKGANHFFDTTHEFDLNDKILTELLVE